MTRARSIRQRARDAGIPEGTVGARIHAGWSVRRALSTPSRARREDATQAERDEAIASVLAGRETQREVAARLGITAAAVGVWLRPHRDQIPREHPMRARVLDLVRGGSTYAEILDATGVWPATTSQWVRAAGITAAGLVRHDVGRAKRKPVRA